MADYPKARYRGTNDEVALGDHVAIRRLFFFWTGRGRVAYVPGVSHRNRQFEHHRVKYIYVDVANGISFASVIDTETGEIPGYIRLLQRTEEPYEGLPDDFRME